MVGPTEHEGPQEHGDGGMGERMREQARQAGHNTRETMSQMTERARQQAQDAARRAREQGQSVVQDQKAWIAAELDHCVSATHAAAERLHQEEDHQLGHVADVLADQIESAAHYVREADVNRMMSDVGRLARRNPGLFFGGMFIAGLAVARFFKSSPPQHQYGEYHNYGYEAYPGPVPARQGETPQAVAPNIGASPAAGRQPSTNIRPGESEIDIEAHPGDQQPPR